MNPWKFLALAALSLSLVHCGGGGGGRGRIPDRSKLCPETYDPLPIKIPKATQLEKGENDQFQLPPGEYTYAGADLYYEEGKGGPQIHIQEYKSEKDETWATARSCVNGLSPSTKAFDVSALGVSHMVVKDEKTVEFDVRRYSFRWIPKTHQIRVKAEPAEDTKFEAPSKVYQEKGTEFEMYKKEDEQYELRFVKEVDQYTIRLAVKYDYSPLPEEETPEEQEEPQQETPEEAPAEN